MKKIASIKVDNLDEPMRMSDYVAGKFEMMPSKKGMKKAIENGLVKLNGVVITQTARFVRNKDIIELYQAKQSNERFWIDLELDVLFEDDHLAIINKPSGVIVSGNQRRSIQNALPIALKPSAIKTAMPDPEPIHRLDYPTSGLLLIGKTHNAVIKLNQLFENKTIDKMYHAVTIGKMKEKGVIENTIKGKSAKTSYEVIQTVESDKFGALNLVKLNPETGRRHQLRIHLSEQGNSILGDREYAPKGKTLLGKGLYLQANGLKFKHPFTEETVDIVIPLAKKFMKIFADTNE